MVAEKPEWRVLVIGGETNVIRTIKSEFGEVTCTWIIDRRKPDCVAVEGDTKKPSCERRHVGD